MIAYAVVVFVVHHRLPRAVPWQRDGYAFRDTGERAVAHEKNAIRQQNRLVDIVGDHEDGLLCLSNDGQQLILDRAPGEGVQCTERFVQQQHFGLDGESPGDADTLLHAARQFGRLFVQGVTQTHHTQVVAAVEHHFFAAPLRPTRADTERHVLQSAEPGQEGMALEDDPAIKRRA